MKNVIHKASWCTSLDTPTLVNRDRLVTPEHPKLCSNDINALEDEMLTKQLPYKYCGNCMK